MSDSVPSPLRSMAERRSAPRSHGLIPREHLIALYQCALRAPDHKSLRPWRFIECHEPEKDLLAHAIVSAFDAQDDSAFCRRVAHKLSLAPHILICVLCPKTHKKVPHIEQVLSMGAAVQTMILATEALGYVAYWRTGPWAYHPHLMHKLGLTEQEKISGFLYLGAQGDTLPPRSSSSVWTDYFQPLTPCP